MEMVQEIEEMIRKYSKFEEDFFILEFLEELEEIKEGMKFRSKG